MRFVAVNGQNGGCAWETEDSNLHDTRRVKLRKVCYVQVMRAAQLTHYLQALLVANGFPTFFFLTDIQ